MYSGFIGIGTQGCVVGSPKNICTKVLTLMNLMPTRTGRKQKLVLQSIACITLGITSIPIYNVLKKWRMASLHLSAAVTFPHTVLVSLNDLYMLLLISFSAILFGIAAAFYLEEWISETNWLRHLIENVVAILTGIPSLLYGLLAIVLLFAYTDVLKTETVESALDIPPFRNRNYLFYAEAATFIALVLPVTIKATQGALRAVATPIRESAYALGATRWQVLTRQVVPIAFPGILAGGCRAMARALAIVALISVIYTWHSVTEPSGMSSSFLLFLGGALFFSIFSSMLMDLYCSPSLYPG